MCYYNTQKNKILPILITFSGLDSYVNEFQEQSGNPAEISNETCTLTTPSMMDPWTEVLYHLLLTITLTKSHRGLQTHHPNVVL